jgi:hypothetical protein
MIPPFDIFHIADGGVLVRLESASSLHGAITRIHVIGELSPGEYFVRSLATNHRMRILISRLTRQLLSRDV